MTHTIWFVEWQHPEAPQTLQRLEHLCRSQPAFMQAELLHSTQQAGLWLLLTRWQGEQPHLPALLTLPEGAKCWCFTRVEPF